MKKGRGQGTCAQQGTQQLKFRGPLSREGECNLLRRAMFGKFVFSRIALLCLIAIYILDHRTISIVFKKIRGKGYLIWKNVFWKFWSYICYTKIALELPQIYLRIFLKLTGQNVYLTPLRQIKNTSAAPLTDKFVRQLKLSPNVQNSLKMSRDGTWYVLDHSISHFLATAGA